MPDLNLDGEFDLLPTDVGGRRRPIRSGYRAALWFGKTAPAGRPQLHSAMVTLREVDELAPGDSAKVVLAPLALETWPAVTTGVRFEVFEGGRHVGGGRLHFAPQAATQPQLRRALHATLEEWVVERFGDRVVRGPRVDSLQPDLIASFGDQSGMARLLVGEVVGGRPTVKDVRHLTAVMRHLEATLGLLVGLDEPSAHTRSAVVAEGGVELPGGHWTPRVRVITTRELARADAQLLPSQEAPERLELLAANEEAPPGSVVGLRQSGA